MNTRSATKLRHEQAGKHPNLTAGRRGSRENNGRWLLLSLLHVFQRWITPRDLHLLVCDEWLITVHVDGAAQLTAFRRLESNNADGQRYRLPYLNRLSINDNRDRAVAEAVPA